MMKYGKNYSIIGQYSKVPLSVGLERFHCTVYMCTVYKVHCVCVLILHIYVLHCVYTVYV